MGLVVNGIRRPTGGFIVGRLVLGRGCMREGIYRLTSIALALRLFEWVEWLHGGILAAFGR